MNTNFRELLPKDFDEHSRVWIYQCNRIFTMQEALQVEEMLKAFVNDWNSHGIPVKGYANLFFGQFVVLIADETAHGVSGCSTDSSVRMIREIEQAFNVFLFDRLSLAFIVNERIQTIPMVQLVHGLQSRLISGDTLYFNNTVQTLGELKKDWLIPLKDSWLTRDKRFQSLIAASALPAHP